MIRITIELISAVDANRNTVLGIATIANDGKRSVETHGERGDYVVTLSKWAPKTDETWLRGRVLNFPRKRRGVWDLLYLALRSAVGRRNPWANE